MIKHEVSCLLFLLVSLRERKKWLQKLNKGRNTGHFIGQMALNKREWDSERHSHSFLFLSLRLNYTASCLLLYDCSSHSLTRTELSVHWSSRGYCLWCSCHTLNQERIWSGNEHLLFQCKNLHEDLEQEERLEPGTQEENPHLVRQVAKRDREQDLIIGRDLFLPFLIMRNHFSSHLRYLFLVINCIFLSNAIPLKVIVPDSLPMYHVSFYYTQRVPLEIIDIEMEDDLDIRPMRHHEHPRHHHHSAHHHQQHPSQYRRDHQDPYGTIVWQKVNTDSNWYHNNKESICVTETEGGKLKERKFRRQRTSLERKRHFRGRKRIKQMPASEINFAGRVFRHFFSPSLCVSYST